MDTRKVAAIAGVGVGTLSSWIQLGLVPDMPVTRGRLTRNFTEDQAIHVSLMTMLVRLRFPGGTAAMIARQRGDHRMLLLAPPGVLEDEAYQLLRAATVPYRPADPLEAAKIREDLHLPPVGFWFTDVNELYAKIPRLLSLMGGCTIVNIDWIIAKVQGAAAEAENCVAA